MGWHFSIIHPLFNQSVKISQLTHKGTAYIFFFVQGVNWAVTDLWRPGLMTVMAQFSACWAQAVQYDDQIYRVTSEDRWTSTMECIVYNVHLGFPRVTSSLKLTGKNGNQIKPIIRVEHLFPRQLIIRLPSKSYNLQTRDNYTCLLCVTQRQCAD